MTNPIKEARQAAGLTQKQMSELLEIPKRTIEDWDADKKHPPKWAEKLILEKLETLRKTADK